MTSVLYKVTNAYTGKSLVATFPGSFDEMKAAVSLAAARYGLALLTFQFLALSVSPARSLRNFRAQSYLNGVVYLEAPDFASLFTWTPAPIAPPPSTIEQKVIFTVGDYVGLNVVQSLKIEGELDSTTGLLNGIGE